MKNAEIKKFIPIIAVTCIFIIISCVIGGVIVSKITCKHDSEYDIELLSYKAPTCQETGLTAGKKCNFCGKVLVKQEVIPISSCNKNVTLPRKEPTCLATGLTEGKKCSVCGDVVVSQNILNKLNCKESEWIVDLEATKTTDGSKHTECIWCGKTIQTQVLAAGSQGLYYREQEDGTYYVSDSLQNSDSNLVIPRMYNGQNVTGIRDYTFRNNANIETVTIPYTVKYIGKYAFACCNNLKIVNLPDSIHTIGSSAFQYCTSLVSIDLPSGIEIIDHATFLFCEALKSVTIPSSVTEIKSDAFARCDSLTNIEFKGTIEQWKSIIKSLDWCHGTNTFTIYCTDGTIAKDGTIIYK